jgi:hypothetical protein
VGGLDPQRDRPAVLRYAVLLARIERVYLWLAQQPDEVFSDPKGGDVHAVFERLEKWETGADRAEDRLAIAPLTRGSRFGLGGGALGRVESHSPVHVNDPRSS